MELTRRSILVYGLLLGVWLLVIGWQIEEHVRFKAYAKTSLRNRSKAIANTLGASIRGLQFRGAVFGDRLQPVLNELVSRRRDELNQSSEVVSVTLLNAGREERFCQISLNWFGNVNSCARLNAARARSCWPARYAANPRIMWD